MKFQKLVIADFRKFSNQEIFLGNKLTAIAGNNGTGKSTVLGLLANSSQLADHRTYLGRPYKGEFSELFSASPDHDPSGSQKVRLEYTDHGESKAVWFRNSWQNRKTRFRVIPRRDFLDGSFTEAKLESPVIYLGLSRLYPIGEADRKMLSRSNQRWDDDGDREWFENKYKHILSIREPMRSVSKFGITGLSRKSGTGIETDAYGPSANSSGQDNIGQILMSVLSFKKLRRDLGSDWDGGLLLIDELDATLHPAAQLRLVDLLIRESNETGFQVVCTTHSTVILEELSGKNGHNPPDRPGNIEVVYLTDANRRLVALRNPAWPQMENDLLIRITGISGVKVGVFSEDGEARWLAEQILESLYPEILGRIDFVEASFGCKQLMKLYAQDFPYLKNRVVLFDGDVSESDIDSKIPRPLREAGRNIVSLPGRIGPEEGVRPENVIYDYLCSLEDSPLWDDLSRYGFTMRILEERGPLSESYRAESDERNKFKTWLCEYKTIFTSAHVISSWAESNPEPAWDFVNNFTRAYNAVAKRTSAAEVPMPKRPETA